MCCNCNLLTPITDEACELLGIEKRMYLTYGRSLDDYISNRFPDYNTYDMVKFRSNLYSNDVINYRTCKHFEFIGEMVPALQLNTLKLYTGKYKQISPVKKEDVDLEYRFYPEFFMDGSVQTY